MSKNVRRSVPCRRYSGILNAAARVLPRSETSSRGATPKRQGLRSSSQRPCPRADSAWSLWLGALVHRPPQPVDLPRVRPPETRPEESAGRQPTPELA